MRKKNKVKIYRTKPYYGDEKKSIASWIQIVSFYANIVRLWRDYVWYTFFVQPISNYIMTHGVPLSLRMYTPFDSLVQIQLAQKEEKKREKRKSVTESVESFYRIVFYVAQRANFLHFSQWKTGENLLATLIFGCFCHLCTIFGASFLSHAKLWIYKIVLES